MSDCPLVRLATNLKLLKQFEQTGQVAIPVIDWLYFFQALAFLNRDGGHREIYCAIGSQHVVFSKTPIKWIVKKEPTQGELLE